MKNKILSDLISRYKELAKVQNSILEAFNIIIYCLKNDNALFVCGNGGSAADSEHIVGELLKGFLLKREIKNLAFVERLKKLYGDEGVKLSAHLQNGLRAISLTSHPALATAFSNDVDASMVFAQQLYALARSNDVLLGISTSGNANNVYKAFQVASAMGVKTILLTGETGGKCSEIVDCSIRVPGTETYKIQEYHLPVYHALCAMLEESFYGSSR